MLRLAAAILPIIMPNMNATIIPPNIIGAGTSGICIGIPEPPPI
jgi:hypothetical protein